MTSVSKLHLDRSKLHIFRFVERFADRRIYVLMRFHK